MSTVFLIAFYFSAAPVRKWMGRPDACSAINLKRRKQEVLDFIRRSLFVNPNLPQP